MTQFSLIPVGIKRGFIRKSPSKMDARYKQSAMIVISIPVTMEMKWNKAGQYTGNINVLFLLEKKRLKLTSVKVFVQLTSSGMDGVLDFF